MKIENQINAGPVVRTEPSPAAQAIKPRANDSAVFSQSNALTQSLRDEPEARADEIERAVNLIGQVDWPPPVVIRRIASLMGMNLYQQS